MATKESVTETYRSFADRFGAEQADALLAAAESHANGVHDKRGSDEFRWAVAICIGYECFTAEDYRAHHGITAPVDEVKAWIRTDADLSKHDGDVDYLALFAGTYDEYMADEASR